MDGDLLHEPEIGPGRTMTARLSEKLTVLSNEVGLHLSALSADMIAMKVDVASRTARLKLGGNYDGNLTLRVDGHVVFARGGARVQARLDIGIIGHRLSLTVPDFEVVPRSFDGRQYLELRLPLFEGRF